MSYTTISSDKLSRLIGTAKAPTLIDVRLDEDFAADVTITARFAVDHFPAFQAALRERSSGRLAAEIVETDEETIMPVGARGADRLRLGS